MKRQEPGPRRIGCESLVVIYLEENDVCRILDKEDKNIRRSTAEMQVQDTCLLQQPIAIGIDPRSIVPLRNDVALLDALHELDKLARQIGGARKPDVISVQGQLEDGFGLCLDPRQPQPHSTRTPLLAEFGDELLAREV